MTFTMRSIVARALPQDCVLCAGASGEPAVCAACEAELPLLAESCPCCAMPSPGAQRCGSCLKRAPHYDRTIALYRYEFPLDRLLQALKYHGRLALAAWFGGGLARRLQTHPRPEVLIPVPLARSRLRERGFNQAVEIARPLSRLLDLELDCRAVRRQRATLPQFDLPLEARARNIRGAFASGPSVAGKRVAVLDDVMTSGATLDEVAATLKRAGAVEVENWVVARTVRHA